MVDVSGVIVDGLRCQRTENHAAQCRKNAGKLLRKRFSPAWRDHEAQPGANATADAEAGIAVSFLAKAQRHLGAASNSH